jgi:hypothetical protein
LAKSKVRVLRLLNNIKTSNSTSSLCIFEGISMSVEVSKDQIFQFLSSGEPEVMAIIGE